MRVHQGPTILISNYIGQLWSKDAAEGSDSYKAGRMQQVPQLALPKEVKNIKQGGKALLGCESEASERRSQRKVCMPSLIWPQEDGNPTLKCGLKHW